MFFRLQLVSKEFQHPAMQTKIQQHFGGFFHQINVPPPSVADRIPDPHVFGPPGIGSVSLRYVSGSGSFYQQAKMVRKTLITTVL